MHDQDLITDLHERCMRHVIVHGCMGGWVHGCMGAWVHGCMGAWVDGCMGGWVRGPAPFMHTGRYRGRGTFIMKHG